MNGDTTTTTPDGTVGLAALLAEAGLSVLVDEVLLVGSTADMAEGSVALCSTRLSDGRRLRVLGPAGTTAGRRGDAADLVARNQRLRDTNDDLRRSNRDLTEFAYIASHDLAEPLRVIGGFVDLLSRRYADVLDERGQRWIHWTVEAVERMESLIASLLQVSRLESDARQPESIRLGDLVDEVAAARHLSSQVEIGPLPTIRGDPVQVRLLLDNLLGNAAKYVRDGQTARVHVHASIHAASTTLVVDDDGIGIAPEHRERAVKMFQRLHRRDEYSGTGIGLTLCERIAQRHGGELRLDESPSGGLRVEVDLPLATPEEEASW